MYYTNVQYTQNYVQYRYLYLVRTVCLSAIIDQLGFFFFLILPKHVQLKLTNPQVTFHESWWNQTCSIIIHKGRGAMFYLILNISLSLSLNVQNDCCSSTISSKLCLKQPSNMAQWMSRLQIGVLPNGSSHQYMSGVPNCRHTYYDTTLFCGNKCLLLLKLLQKIPSSLKFIRVQKYSIC